MGRLARSDTPITPVTAADGALRFGYCECGPGERVADTESQHCMVIPAQDTPLRVITTRDGVARSYTLTRGDIALASSGSKTVWRWLDPAKVILIWLDPEALQRFVEIEMRLILTGSKLQDEVVTRDPDLAAAAQQLHDATVERDVGADILFDALARVFLVTLVRRYGNRDATQPGGFDLHAYAAVLDHIEAHLDSKITPADLARVAGMSAAVFARKFKLKTGQSPMNFVKQVRLRAATAHVHDGRLSLGEIAIRCGFADQAHFSRVFRQAHGRAPGKYRSALRS